MTSKQDTRPPSPLDGLFRAAAFWLFSTLGMTAIGLALLAGPVAGYFHDQQRLAAREQRLAALQRLHDEREKLLANADLPSVVERAAIDQLNYLPPNLRERSPGHLPPTSPALEHALSESAPENTPSPSSCDDRSPDLLLYCSTVLATQPRGVRLLLAALGAALVVTSLACFNKRS